MITFLRNLKTRWNVRNIKLDGNIHDKKFTIISNNCWGAEVYRECGIQYSTPFVGLFIHAPDYIKLVKDLKSYLSQPLEFITTSKYYSGQKHISYPIARLGDIEIHFLHYKSSEEAKLKWERRVRRIYWDKLFIQFSERDQCTEKILEDFDQLKINNKVCFTSLNRPHLKSTIWIKDCKPGEKIMDGKLLFMYSKKYFDIASWIQSGLKT